MISNKGGNVGVYNYFIQVSTDVIEKWFYELSCEFQSQFHIFWCLYHLVFDLETIGVS